MINKFSILQTVLIFFFITSNQLIASTTQSIYELKGEKIIFLNNNNIIIAEGKSEATDQFGRKIQIVGHLQPEDSIHLARGSFEEGKFLTLIEREGQLVGAVGMGMVPGNVQARNLLGEPISIISALEKLSS